MVSESDVRTAVRRAGTLAEAHANVRALYAGEDPAPSPALIRDLIETALGGDLVGEPPDPEIAATAAHYNQLT